MGLLSILTIIFVVCKLFHIIDWSWWVVFIPTYVDVVSLALLGLYLIIKLSSR